MAKKDCEVCGGKGCEYCRTCWQCGRSEYECSCPKDDNGNVIRVTGM